MSSPVAFPPIPAPKGKLGTRRCRRRLRQALGWGVHFYTALGLVAAGGIAVVLLNPSPASFRVAFLLMVVATLIDATDGTLARLVRVKEALPGFDGARLDDLIDFQTYTSLPLLLLYQARILPEGQEFWLLAPLVASAYGFCQAAAKTADGYFLGFPSYWNLVALYLYLLQPGAGVSISVLLTFSLLTFVPSRYLYPTRRGGRVNRLTSQFGVAWCALIVLILWRLPADEGTGSRHADDLSVLLTWLSLFFPFFYLVASWAISLDRLRRRRRNTEMANLG
jgi:phosphatidylcholine synthase